jgi:hypothetical protein
MLVLLGLFFKFLNSISFFKMISLKKRKGKLNGELFLKFLEEDRFVMVCHANDMHLDTVLPLKKNLNQIDFQLKFLKRKVVLHFFDKFHKYNAVQKLLNGSLVIIFPKNKQNVRVDVFHLMKQQKKMILLGFYLNRFYLFQKGYKIISQIQHFEQKDLSLLTAQYKCLAISDILKTYHSQFVSFLQIERFIHLKKGYDLSSEKAGPQDK